jgi:hypothetical protein
MNKICPIMVLAQYIPAPEPGPAACFCIAAECAWWNAQLDCCGLVALREMVTGDQEEGEQQDG